MRPFALQSTSTLSLKFRVYVCTYMPPQRPSRRCFASRTRVPGRRHLRDNAALGPTARNPRGARPTREPTHVHPAQQNGSSTPGIRTGACGACRRAPAARLGGESCLACWNGGVPGGTRQGTTRPVRRVSPLLFNSTLMTEVAPTTIFHMHV